MLKLLTTATGRLALVNRSVPSRPITDSFSPRMPTSFTPAGISSTIRSTPVGATALTPPGPAPPEMRSNRSLAVRNSLNTTPRVSSLPSIVSTPIVAV